MIDTNQTVVLTPRFLSAIGGQAAECHGERVGGAVDRLRSEHGNIARLLLVLEAHLARLHGGEDVDEQLLLDAVSYLIDYVDQFHHVPEDRIVALLAEREPLAQAMVKTISAQHEDIASQGAALRDRLQRAVVDEPVARQDLVRLGFSYAAALRRNMAFEERVVFPLASVALATADWNAIDDAPKACADPLSGDAIDERYRNLFEELARRAGCECSYAPAPSAAEHA